MNFSFQLAPLKRFKKKQIVDEIKLKHSFRRGDVSSDWRDINTGDSMVWTNWADNFPNSGKDYDCVILDTTTGKMKNIFCSYDSGYVDIVFRYGE